MDLVLVAAVAANGVIGRDGEMPWHYPEDLAHFKETTTGHPVVMGRTTYESIAAQLDGPLPDRANVVLSTSDPDVHEAVAVVESVDDAVDAAADAADELGVDTAYVVGGASVYEQFLPRADALVLTEIHDSYAGDTCFPEWEDGAGWTADGWEEVARDDREELSFVRYERR
ncbi:dihydrofolate reductase [Halomicrococcus gelatinilyticus]|uniref:dihydrofolate reductase n=1 Tax=Halomicrococcus gelatinilyticus TaxID=1702103 RepID=UPI002E109F84